MVAENVKQIINERGLKQNAIAEKAGYTPKQFNNLLNGYKIMRDSDILRICRSLSVTPNDLFKINA